MKYFRMEWALVLALFVTGFASLGMAAPAVEAEPAPCADLQITSLDIQPVEPFTFRIVEGKNVSVTVGIRNDGSCESLSFTVQWKSDDRAQTGPSYNVDNLGPGQSTQVEFVYAFPSAGDFTTVVTLDTDNAVDETNENNNIQIKPAFVWPDQADLVVTDFSVNPPEPVQGVNAQITVVVKNQGSKDAGPFVVQWKQAQLAPTGPSTQVDFLPAGASIPLIFDFAFPNAGDFATIVTVDTDRTVDEWNEDNNTPSPFPVTVRESAPDLVILGVSILPVDPAPGYPQNLPVEDLNARIAIRVRNQGNVAAGPFVVQWKSALNAPTGPAEQTVNGLAPDSETLVVFEYAFPNDGNFTTQVTVDSDNDVAESNETNNLEIKSVQVQKAEIDLIVRQFSVEPAPGVPASIPPNPVANRLSRVTIVVANTGNFPAGDFVVEWKPAPLTADISGQVNGLKYGTTKTITFDYTYRFPGEFLTTATVDSTNRVREINEDNNTASKRIVVEPQLPDLEILPLSFVFNPAQPVQGTKAKVSFRVRNRGNTPAGPFEVQWKATPLAPDLSQQVNGLAVGATTLISFEYTYPFPGEFQSTATVDATNRVRELDEENNSRTRPVTVLRATQDLVIVDTEIKEQCLGPSARVLIDPVEPILVEDKPYQVCVTIQNLGNSPVGPFVVSWNPDAFNLIIPSLNTLTQQVDVVGAGQQHTVIFDFAYPQEGEFRSVAEVDAFNIIRETNEENNLDILNVVVEASGPDLVISAPFIEPEFFEGEPLETPGLVRPPIVIDEEEVTCEREYDDSPGDLRNSVPPFEDTEEPRLTQGELSRVCIIVRNEGNRPSGPFIVEWNPDALGLLTPSPATVSQQVDNLRPGRAVAVEFFYVYVDAGTYNTVAKADAFNSVAELDEANNVASTDVVVDASQADLIISKLDILPFYVPRIPPDTSEAGPITDLPPRVETQCSLFGSGPQAEPLPIQGERVRVCISVRNVGFEPTGPFVVSWNPDARLLGVPSSDTLTAQVNQIFPFQTKLVEFEYTYEEFGGARTIAKADAFNNVDESREGNNEKILNVDVSPAPLDLQITSFSIAAKDPTPEHGNDPIRGETAVATITVFNNGDYPTGSFVVQWLPTGEGLGPRAVIDGLLPFDSTTIQLESSFFGVDTYDSKAIVDVNDTVIETNEFNNESIRTVTVQPPPVDLDITSFTIADVPGVGINPAPGDTIVATVRVLNRGSRAVGPFSVQVLPTGEGFGGTERVDSEELGLDSVLGPNEFVDVQVEARIGNQHGTFTAKAIVDPSNAIVETNENNNEATRSLTVLSRIDLDITAMSFSPSTPTRGQTVRATITVRNNGSRDVGPFAVQFLPTGSGFGGTERADSEELGQDQLLGPGESVNVVVEMTVNQAGNYTAKAIVDPSNAIVEFNEFNNEFTRSLTVNSLRTVLRVDPEVFVRDNLEGSGNGEWLGAIVINDQSIKVDEGVGDNDTIDKGAVDVTVIDAQPLIVAAFFVEDDSGCDFLIFGCDVDITEAGAAVSLQFEFSDWGDDAGTIRVDSQEGPSGCPEVGDAVNSCFQLRFTVNIQSQTAIAPVSANSLKEYAVIPAEYKPIVPGSLPDAMRLEGMENRLYMPSLSR